MVNEELICDGDNDCDFEVERESGMLCSLWQWRYLNHLYTLAAENSDILRLERVNSIQKGQNGPGGENEGQYKTMDTDSRR
jgi:hypothetical protein